MLAGRSFVDLAREFSEVGFLILATMGKTELTVMAVQSGILRASFLKNTGSVVQAWHALGATIRDAQEIGLHTERVQHSSSANTDTQWDEEMRHKIWFVLHNWDIHMAIVLGRPIATMKATGNALQLPDDLAQRKRQNPPRKRTDRDPPTPFSVIRVGYEVAYRYFLEVRSLESRGARTEDYDYVLELHAEIVGNMSRIPAWCRREEPDVHFDGSPECYWLPAARQALTDGIHFVLLSLHRPYIFSVAESRTEAMKAALKILTAQKNFFDLSELQQDMSFNMIYPLFDAMVISLAIAVLFPKENLMIIHELVENVRWGVEILSKRAEYNAMARSAYDVVSKLFSRLQQSCLIKTGKSAEVQGAESSDLDPPEAHFENLLPPLPLHDLFVHDNYAKGVRDIGEGFEVSLGSPRFDDHYPDNSFWDFINNLD